MKSIADIVLYETTDFPPIEARTLLTHKGRDLEQYIRSLKSGGTITYYRISGSLPMSLEEAVREFIGNGADVPALLELMVEQGHVGEAIRFAAKFNLPPIDKADSSQ